jgi:hypothetical protein
MRSCLKPQKVGWLQDMEPLSRIVGRTADQYHLAFNKTLQRAVVITNEVVF